MGAGEGGYLHIDDQRASREVRALDERLRVHRGGPVLLPPRPVGHVPAERRVVRRVRLAPPEEAQPLRVGRHVGVRRDIGVGALLVPGLAQERRQVPSSVEVVMGSVLKQ